jgi:hypothetical protein
VDGAGEARHPQSPHHQGDADDGCDILRRTFIHNVSDPEYPNEWCYNDKGEACRTAFEEVEDE